MAYQVSLNGGTFAATSPNLSNLADGDYVFRAVVTDAAGNSSTQQYDRGEGRQYGAGGGCDGDGAERGHGNCRRLHHQCGGADGERNVHRSAGAGEKIQVSADGGTTWVDATTVGTNWSASGVTLSAGTDTLSVQTIDTAGNTTSGNGHSYTLGALPAVLTVLTPNGYDMHGLYGDIANSTINTGTADATHFDATNAGSGHTFHVVGTGLTYDLSGNVTGGTISEIDIDDTLTGSTLVVMAGFAIDAVAMSNAVNAFKNSNDPTQLTAIFNQYSFQATGGAGNDNILSFVNADYSTAAVASIQWTTAIFSRALPPTWRYPSQNTGNAAGDTYSNINSLIGTGFNDVLIGNSSTDALEGGAGADTLIGGGGSLDFASYGHAQSGVVANLASPNLNTGDAAGDSYSGINGLIGSNFADTLTGDNNDNYLRGRGGGDTLDGGGGSDTADYFNGPAVRADLSNPATNTGDAAGDTYISIENLRGSSFNDILIGDAGPNTLDGGLGLDQTSYINATGPIMVNMAAGTVSGSGVGNDTLISLESVVGSNFDDIYIATGYAGASAVGSVPAQFNESEGMGGNDSISSAMAIR